MPVMRRPASLRDWRSAAILGVTGYRNPTPPKSGMMRKNAFIYEAEHDGYRCPQGQLLIYATTGRSGYRHYTSHPAICRTCPLLASCTANAKAIRTITRHVWQDARERTDAHRLTSWGKAIYKRRKETVERSFADAKQLHGHRYARFRSLVRVAGQCLLAAAATITRSSAIVKSFARATHGLRSPAPIRSRIGMSLGHLVTLAVVTMATIECRCAALN